MRFGFKNLDTGEEIQGWDFTSSQEKFWTSEKKFVLFSGGYGCGKSMVLTLKAIELALKYPKNYILMGRLTYPELRDTLLKEFFSLCPEHLIKDYLKAEGRVIFWNKSEIVFRHLDTIAEGEIRSMNLGAFFIDQAEEIERAVFNGLRGRLRRQLKDAEDNPGDKNLRGYLSCNPALSWLFDEFKQRPKPEYEVIEASTLENKQNLPEEYVKDLMNYPENYKKQYVYGIWDTDLLSDKVVFDREYIFRLAAYQKEPLRVKEGLEIWKEYVPGHRYQMGIDAAEGGESGFESTDKDEAAISIVDLNTLEEVATWSGRVPPDVLAEKSAQFAYLYQGPNDRCLLIPEMNSIGVALVNALKQKEDVRIYQREEFDRTLNKKVERVGWRTTFQTKPLLISRFQERLRLQNPKIYSEKTINQFKTFIYSDLAKKKGMGAQEGFHDDRLIAVLLAFWQRGPVKEGSVSGGEDKTDKERGYTIKDGKIKIDALKPQLEVSGKNWMTH